MPRAQVIIRSIDIKRLLDYRKNPPKELDMGAHIRVNDIEPVEKGKAHILFEVLYSMKNVRAHTLLMEARVEIDVIYEDKEEELVEMYKRWNKEGAVREDVYSRLGNSAFQLGAISILPLTEKMRLPPIIPIPSPIPIPKKKR